MTKNQKIYRQCHFMCEICGKDRGLLVHHIDEDRTNNEFINLQVLCTSCHAVIHKRIKNINKMRHYYEISPLQLTFDFEAI